MSPSNPERRIAVPDAHRSSRRRGRVPGIRLERLATSIARVKTVRSNAPAPRRAPGAERPCKVRPRNSNPVDRGLRPPKDDGKIFSYLYPAELLSVLALPTEVVPLRRKIFYVLACYVGLRKGSLLALRWR